jgi:hypothetical protein
MTPYNQAHYACNAGRLVSSILVSNEKLLRNLLWGAQQLDVVLQTHFDTILYYALLCSNIIPE